MIDKDTLFFSSTNILRYFFTINVVFLQNHIFYKSYSNLLANSANSLRSPLTKFMWANNCCPFIFVLK